MKLSYVDIQDRTAWEKAGIALPKFDWKAMCAETERHPTWVHFGAGNIFRGFIAKLQQELLDQGLVKGGIVAADTFDYDIIDKIYKPHDNMTLMVSLLPDGSMEKEVIASIAQGLRAGAAFPEDMEKMKVTTCLNPLHTALAVYGCLLGYDSIAAEMADSALKKLVEKIGCDEGIPVVVDPKILSPMDFIHEVIDQRLPNPFIPDTPQRIATDTSQKVPVRFGETIKSYLARDDLDPANLTYIPLAIAGWLRYLLAVDDEGRPMVCSADPMLDTLQRQLSSVKLGQPETASEETLTPILSNKALFAVDLREVGLAEKVSGMLREMLAGPGAVRSALEYYLP